MMKTDAQNDSLLEQQLALGAYLDALLVGDVVPQEQKPAERPTVTETLPPIEVPVPTDIQTPVVPGAFPGPVVRSGRSDSGGATGKAQGSRSQ